MDSTLPPENVGSMALLTNKTTQMSNKLLHLANPKTSGSCICSHVRLNTPSIGIVWYLPVCWLFHFYLIYTCIRNIVSTTDSMLITVVQVLLTLSVAAMLLFTASTFLKVEQSPGPGCTFQKRSTLRQLILALRCQLHPLHALSALLLIHCYLLLRLTTAKPLDTFANNDSGAIEVIGMNPKTSEWMSLSSLNLGDSFTYLMYYVNCAVPLMLHFVQESDPVWQMEKLWGFLYSVILLLTSVKYLTSSFTFFVVNLVAYQSSHSIIFECFPVWFLVLYMTSVFSLFLHSISLKIYVELSCRVTMPDATATKLTLRRKARSYPSAMGVTFTTLFVVASEIFPILKLYFFLIKKMDPIILFLFAFNIGFCLSCVTVCILVSLRRRCCINTFKARQRRTDSGVCLANSFVYQSSPDVAKTKC